MNLEHLRIILHVDNLGPQRDPQYLQYDRGLKKDL